MKNINRILALVFVCLAAVSCKKDIDLQPTDVILEPDAFLTIDHLQAGLNTAYASIMEKTPLLSMLSSPMKLDTEETMPARDNLPIAGNMGRTLLPAVM